MGRIVDVLVNRSGQVRAAIIDFGGFLGVGSRKVAVDWHAIQFAPDGKLDRIIVSLSRNEVRLAPEFKRGEPVVVLGPSSSAPPANNPPQTTNIPPSANAAPPPANTQQQPNQQQPAVQPPTPAVPTTPASSPPAATNSPAPAASPQPAGPPHPPADTATTPASK
jgi:predicted component of type VI protein secretion system